MKVIMTIIFAFLSLILITGEGFAITIDDIQDMTTVTPSVLANGLVGGNVVPGSAVYTGAAVAAGTFRNGLADGIGIDQGVILTTGDIFFAIGPNSDGMVGMANFTPGDSDLNGFVSGGTFNASVLEFNFIPPPTQNRVTFTFVFASDEYPEFVGTQFNDVFGLFINGVNIARVPGTANPVTINTLNGTATPSLFNDNSDTLMPRFMTQYDGFSNVVSVSATVVPGVSNSLKIAIADTADPSVDSAVFLGPAVFSSVATFSISGTVRTAGAGPGGGAPLAGVTITLSGGAFGTTTTDVNGNYTLTGLPNGNYTVTPSRTGFAFTPVNRAVAISNANVIGQNFTAAATAGTFSISGTITASGGVPLANITVNLTGAATATTTTNAQGVYTFTGLANGNYTVTPSQAGFAFTPVNRAVTINNANVTGQDFVRTAPAGNFSISGTVRTVGGGVGPGGGLGAPVAGVTITLSGAAAGTATTDASGNFTFPGLANGGYTVTPSRAGFAFTPVNRAVTINNANVTGQNFTATVVTATFSITGTVSTGGGSPMQGVTMTLSGNASGTVTTDINGNYTFSGLANGGYTVTPSQAGFTFTPVNRAVTINNSNVTGQNFVGTAVAGTFSISGTVRARVVGVGVGAPVPGVTITLSGTASGIVTTDANGNYTLSGLANGGYIVTPSQAGFTFAPVNRAVTINNSNVTLQNFTRQ